MIQARKTTAMVGQGIAYLALALYALLCIYPFIWMASAAFKTYDEVLKNPSPIPWNPTLLTLTETWDKLHFFNYFFNSMKVSILTVVGILFIYSLAAYAFACLDFTGRNNIFVFYLAMLFVPGITVLLPLIILERKLGLLGTHAGIIWPTINGTGPFAVFLLRNYFMQMP